jgi:tetratricopeptide (TPR) repeat protein
LKDLCVGPGLAAFLLAAARHGLAAGSSATPLDALERAVAAAEARLQAGDSAGAEARYADVLFQGWLLAAALERTEPRPEAALQALRNAASFAGGEAASLRLLAKELAAAGQVEEAVGTLERAASAAPGDPELTFVLATDCLWLKRTDAAERLFARLLELRPIAETHVLIGHAYRDAAEYSRAREALRAALEQDPSARRAHYYLGTVILADPGSGPERLEAAIREFEAELKLAPEDALSWDQLGLALLEAGRHAEALGAARKAAGLEARALYVYHLGRCQLALDQASEAVASSRRALELATEQGAGEPELERMHYQLGLALRQTGARDEAAAQLAESRRIAARWTEAPRQAPASAEGSTAQADSPLAKIPQGERAELKRRALAALAGAYLNLGVMQAQREAFDRAIELLEQAARLDATSPQVQYALGIACFGAKQFDRATGPLSVALAANPGDARLKRTLAMAWLDTGMYAKAAELLSQDPERETDPSVRFAYGLALAHTGREAEAEVVFRKLLAEQGESPELLEALRQLRYRR